MKKFLVALMLGMFVTALAGCNTVEGLGEDVEDLGEGIQDAAD